MKIVFCAYDGKDVINGINAWLLRLLPELVKRGFNIQVLFITWAKKEDCTIIPHLSSVGVSCNIIPRPHYSEDVVKYILIYLKKNMPDVFVAGQMPPALHALKWTNSINLPSIAVLHNDDKEYESILNNFLSKNLLTQANKIVSVSKVLTEKAKLYCNKDLIVEIPCGAPVAKARNSYNGTNYHVAYVGRLAKHQKNIDLIASAFCKLAQKHPDLKISIFGSGPDSETVHSIMRANGNPTNITVHGNLMPDDLKERMTTVHSIVLMSDFEGLPVAIMEAMGMGIIPVCKRIASGISELIIDHQTGLLFDTEQDFFDKIIWLKDHCHEWDRMSESSYQLIKDKYSDQKNSDMWSGLLESFSERNIETDLKIPTKICLPPRSKFLMHDQRRPSVLQKIIFRSLHFIKSKL